MPIIQRWSAFLLCKLPTCQKNGIKLNHGYDEYTVRATDDISYPAPLPMSTTQTITNLTTVLQVVSVPFEVPYTTINQATIYYTDQLTTFGN